MDSINRKFYKAERHGVIRIIQKFQKQRLISRSSGFLSETNFSDQVIECREEEQELINFEFKKVFIHGVCYFLCPSLKMKNILTSYDGVVRSLRHFLYTNVLDSDISLIEMVHHYELGFILNLPQLSNRVLKLIPKKLTIENFGDGFKVVKSAWESDDDGQKKIDSLIFLFKNFYFENQNTITGIDPIYKKILNLVRVKTEVTIGDDDYGKIIQSAKEELWKSKEYKDLTLICTDGVTIERHKAVVAICPLFSSFDHTKDPNHYRVDIKSKPLLLFLEFLYTRKVDFKSVISDVLYDLYHICNQNEYKELAMKIYQQLLSLIDGTNCSQMLEFYMISGVVDKNFFSKVQGYMKSSSPSELCSIYAATCRAKNQEMLKDVVTWMISTIDKDTRLQWLLALKKHLVDDKTVWKKLGSTMHPDMFHLWNSLQEEITILKQKVKESERKIETLQQIVDESGRKSNKRKRKK